MLSDKTVDDSNYVIVSDETFHYVDGYYLVLAGKKICPSNGKTKHSSLYSTL